MAKKTILIRLDKDLNDSIHRLMGHVLKSEDGIILEKMHHGSKQQFYRKLLSIGVGKLKQEWDMKIKEYESQDDN